MIFPVPEGTEIKGTDVEKFRESNLPPTYFAYGSRDPFVGEFEECIEALEECFLASNFPHFHRYDSLKSALYIHAVSKNINTFPKNQGRIRAAIAVEILDFTVMYR